MDELQQYIQDVLGIEIEYETIHKKKLAMLPLYMNQLYRFYTTKLYNRAFILAENRDPNEFSILKTEKHFKLVSEVFDKNVALYATNMTSLNRKRLIEKGISFIVPEKQLFLPDLLMDLREDFRQKKKIPQIKRLYPSAQVIILYKMLHQNYAPYMEGMSFKELAYTLGYTPMAISYAAENLKNLEICTIVGEKEKYLRFNSTTSDMWHDLEYQKLLLNPVIKKVFVDEIKGDPSLLDCSFSALAEYTNMNPSTQQYKAIEKTAFYSLKKNNAFLNLNETEGKLCLEVWKYNPMVITKDLEYKQPVVDPLSLYLSLKNYPNERVEDALEQLIEFHVW